MAADPTLAQKSSPIDDPGLFESEIPTYRALNPLALASGALGLLAGLSFVSPLWLAAGFLAVVLGFFADYQIRKLPDLMTGRWFAHAGIAMGLMFGVSSVTYTVLSNYFLRRDSLAFAKEFTATLNNAKKTTPPDTADVMWYMLFPEMRKGITPQEARVKIAQITEGRAKIGMIETQIRQMAKFAGTENPIEVVEVEDASFHERDSYANVLLKVGDGTNHFNDKTPDSGAKADPKKPATPTELIIGEGPENALLKIHGVIVGRDYSYFVEQIYYPYKPKSIKVVPTKPKDDGHGHDH